MKFVIHKPQTQQLQFGVVILITIRSIANMIDEINYFYVTLRARMRMRMHALPQFVTQIKLFLPHR